MAKNPKYDRYQRDLPSMVYNFSHKMSYGDGAKSEVMPNQELEEDLHKLIIKRIEKPKVHSSFKDNTWSAELVDMQLMSKFNKLFHFLLCVINIYIKYAQM